MATSAASALGVALSYWSYFTTAVQQGYNPTPQDYLQAAIANALIALAIEQGVPASQSAHSATSPEGASSAAGQAETSVT